ncbi:MAG: DinB family protein [Calditrichaeota bacterium]|nr:DinB family protein [Calditrichota bacterium]MCB0291103.1 DinB family protein [Calditrichota bacterium]MCB0294474.1 DinB family protein [Calditrichota bacterium]MCB0303362.1 DinB family protein [Calditrichota bacterium]MCB9088954.1 DinB family protein [Calditrichia bacterium]
MQLNTQLLAEFRQEAAKTRKTLERVADEKLNWRPHPKSYTMGELATHIANLPGWTAITINQDEFDLAPPGGGAPPRTVAAKSREEILELFDTKVAEAAAALEAAKGDALLQPWTLLSGGEAVFTLPKAAVLRNFVLNHSIHHRAQLCVYLRLNDIPVPALYGPSADES